jgi:putative flippase GtrA
MKIHKQFIRYAIVGLASNAIAYLIYIALTRVGLGPKVTMSLLYGLGVLQTFIFNKRWTFKHGGAHGLVFIRYCVTYGLGYVVNLVALLVLVDQQGYPHEIVQGVMIFALAVMLFLLQKYWVFKQAIFGRL